MAARSAARPISPPSASISRTRWPFAVPPMAGLHDICPMPSRFIVSSSVRQPMRAAASAASQPACPAPMTGTSQPCMPSMIAHQAREPRLQRPGAWHRMSAAMEFGLSLPGRGPLATPDSILKLATSADRLGYHALFVTDHVVLPASMARSVYPYSSTGHLPGGAAQDYLEPLAVLAWLAHVTRKIRIGTSVLVIPYRNPVVTAKTLATIDRLSNGRVILGAGVGWLREEFEALAAPPFEARGAVTDEYLQLMRATWTTDPVRFEGKHYTLRDVHALPKPVQRHGIPIWIGGHTDAAVKRAATFGDAWHPIALR